MKARSDTEQAILDVIEEAFNPSFPERWITRFGRDGISTRLDRLWKQRFPARRNRPTYTNVQSALRRLVAEGILETKRDGLDLDDLYRKAVKS